MSSAALAMASTTRHHYMLQTSVFLSRVLSTWRVRLPISCSSNGV
jgi:hypothetical protein